jgi:hypothetical protein
MSMRIHSVLDLCSSFLLACLPAMLHVMVSLRIDHTPHSSKRTLPLQSVILKPESTLCFLEEYLSEVAAQTSGTAKRFVLQHCTKLEEESTAAELGTQGPPVSALHPLAFLFVDYAAVLNRPIEIHCPRIQATQGLRLCRRHKSPRTPFVQS